MADHVLIDIKPLAPWRHGSDPLGVERQVIDLVCSCGAANTLIARGNDAIREQQVKNAFARHTRGAKWVKGQNRA